MKEFRQIRLVGRMAALLAVIASTGCLSSGSRPYDLGPVVSRDQSVNGRERFRSLGPILDCRKGLDAESFSAVRPLVSRATAADGERSITDIVWPLAMVKGFRNETDWRALNAFGHDFDTTDDDSRHRWSFFPLVFGGQDAEGQRYFSVFPLGGTLHEFLGRDRIFFFLFPLYSRSVMKDLVTHSVLWPIFSRTTGEGIDRFRVFPLYGHSKKAGEWSKRFVLWPFWSSVRLGDDGEKGGGFILFPLYGRIDAGNRKTRMVIPPLFKWETDTDHCVVNCPWPLFQYASGSLNKLYFWPLWGTKQIGPVRSSFVLWPVVRSRVIANQDRTLRRFNIVPFVHYESETPTPVPAAVQEVGVPAVPPSGKATSRHFKLWPLLSYTREKQDVRFRLLDLWPLKNTPGIERNWAPLWSFFRHRRHGENRETEFLWGLFRRSRSEDQRSFSVFPLISTRRSTGEEPSRRVSLLGGLVGYESNGLRRQLRLLYFIRLGSLQDGPSGPVDEGGDAP